MVPAVGSIGIFVNLDDDDWKIFFFVFFNAPDVYSERIIFVVECFLDFKLDHF